MTQLFVRSWHVRKRDKAVVRVEQVTKDNISYCTMPMLLVYDTTRAAFTKNFRPATAAEVAPHKEALP